MAALDLCRASLPPPETAVLRIARRGPPPPPPLSPSTTIAATMRPRHTRARPSLLGAALIVAVAVLAHVAVMTAKASPTVSASGTSKPAPTANTFVDSNGQPFANCMSTNPNTAYCPHNAGNSEQPEAAKTYNTTSMLRMTWNSKWPSFATTGAVDLYLCPTDGTKCIPMATAMSVSVEIVDALIDPAKVKPGRYTYVAVPLNNKPEDTSFGERGVELAIQAGPTSSTTSSTSSTASPTATSSVGPVPIPTASVLAKSDGNEDNGGLTTLQLALIIAAAAAALIGLALLLIARRRRHQKRRLKSGAVVGTSGSAKSAGGTAVVAVPAGAAAAAPYDVLRETASAEKVGTGGTAPRTTAETPVATAAVPGAASAAAITPATPDGLTALNGSAVNLTPPGAISNADAILIANSFKLALKKSIDDDDDDEDIHTMINNLGMRPVPSGDPNEPFMFMTTSVPPTAVASGAAVAAGLIPPPPPPPSSSAGATRHGSLPRQGSLLSDAGAPIAAASPHMRLGVARTSDLGASTGTIDSLLAASAIAAAAPSAAAAGARASPSPSSLASPPSAVHDRIVVERVSMDHRDREQLLLNRHAAVKLVKSNPCLVVGPIAGSSSGGAGSDRDGGNGGGGAVSEAATPMTRTPSTRSDAALVEDAAGGGGATPPPGPSRA
ncbi:hypothetical protein AMAG_16345 [Allomyces macrogynus ATCC 38327]|uniref:Uncharacterized protein n=1 Tax=Allomyces macrogynus (strain ATCC 38327) TaxID=578462 RepID=A0A0L0TB25_ALLM3|nr:hypothetical protein AMAG_16345 [Allomyces macrogynus ATCC 38327]|eukprot:KNE71921.1 hypothetical protein AMAG_16345 [Allomyces macrogynus ATCC 38327]